MRSICFCIFIFLLTNSAVSQSDTLILLSGEKFAGKIDLLLPTELKEEIVFKRESDKKTLQSNQFTRLVVGGISYRVVKFQERFRIMRVELSGYLSILSYRLPNGYDFSETILYKADGSVTSVPTITFKKVMNAFFADCQVVVDKLENGSGRSDLNGLVRLYNEACVKDGTAYPAPQNTSTLSPMVNQISEILDILEDLKNKPIDQLSSDELRQLKSIQNYLKECEEELNRILENR